MNNAGTRYVEKIYITAKTAAEAYKEAQEAPFEVGEGEIRFRKERYIKWSWCLWGAIQALNLTENITQEMYETYEERIERLDEIVYYEE